MRAVVVVALAGCFRPSPQPGAACAAGNACPSPLECSAGICVDPGQRADASIDAPIADARVDAPADAYVGPILLLHMDDDPSGGTAIDSAGNHKVTCTQCPTLTSNARVGTGAWRFGGSDEVDVGPAGDFTRTGPSTLALWVKMQGVPADFQAPAAKNLPPNDASYGMSVGSDLLASYYTSNATGQEVGQTPVTLGAWHHLAMTWDGNGTVVGYLDGTLDDQYTIAVFSLDPHAPLVIGDVDGSNNLTGDVDELAYYDRALSAAEIAALANP